MPTTILLCLFLLKRYLGNNYFYNRGGQKGGGPRGRWVKRNEHVCVRACMCVCVYVHTNAGDRRNEYIP